MTGQRFYRNECTMFYIDVLYSYILDVHRTKLSFISLNDIILKRETLLNVFQTTQRNKEVVWPNMSFRYFLYFLFIKLALSVGNLNVLTLWLFSHLFFMIFPC